MATTKVYKTATGFVLNIVVGSDFLEEIEYAGLRFQEVDGVNNVVITNLLTEGNHFIPIADVVDGDGSAIGSNTEAEVRTYIDKEMAK